MVRRLITVARSSVTMMVIPFTPRFGALKRSLVTPENESKLTESWNTLLKALESRTAEIEKTGPAVRIWCFSV